MWIYRDTERYLVYGDIRGLGIRVSRDCKLGRQITKH